jgi:hypothetical protein
MHHQQQNWSDKPYRVPTIPVWVRIGPRCVKRIVEDQGGRFE